MISDNEYYEMLLPETRKVIEADVEEKIAYVRTEKFIPYRRAEEILKTMEDIFTQPRKHRMPCLLIYGESNSGKSSIISKFNRWHPPTDGYYTDALPVVVIEVNCAEPASLYDHILENILIPFKKSHVTTNDYHKDTLDMSEGILGYIVEIVEKCAVRALEKGKERISEDLLKEIDFAVPAEQREAYRA